MVSAAVITNGEAKPAITTPSPQASAVPRSVEQAGKTKAPEPAQQPKVCTDNHCFVDDRVGLTLKFAERS